MVPPPEGFSRPPSAACSYTHFDNVKIQDMDDLMQTMPRTPAVLATHDVYHQDWIRFMQDLASVWLGKFPIPEASEEAGRPRSAVATDLVELWNASYFNPRGVELIICKGRKRRNGKYAGMIDMDLPGFDLTTERNSEVDYMPPGGAGYGSYGGVYGGQGPTTIEGREARLRRKEIQEEDRRRKERELKWKSQRAYSLYLACLSPSGHG